MKDGTVVDEEREFWVVEIVRYKVKADNEDDACERITNDGDRDMRVVEVDDRYAYPVRSGMTLRNEGAE